MYTAHIFLDTSILYKDPFWKGNFAKELLQIAHGKQADIYLSRVVVSELIRNYEKLLDEENGKLGKILANCQHYNFSGHSDRLLDKNSSIIGIKQFYDDLYNQGVLTVLEYDNELLPEIVDRAILRKKPFGENKTELKDALIWLTYAQFVEEYQLDNCVFITDNVNDFCDIDKIKFSEVVIHNELLKDTNRFTVYRSVKEFLQKEKENLRVASVKFASLIQEQDFDSIFIIKILKTNFGDEVKKFIKNKFEYSNLNYIFGTKYNVEGFLAFSDVFYLHEVSNIETDIFGEQCIVSGELRISCNAQGFEYISREDMFNPYKEHLAYSTPEYYALAEDFNLFNEKEMHFKVIFSFYYDGVNKPFNLKIESADIVKV